MRPQIDCHKMPGNRDCASTTPAIEQGGDLFDRSGNRVQPSRPRPALAAPAIVHRTIPLDITPDTDRQYRRVINSWAMYDWANSAFVTVIMAAVFPVYFRTLAREAGLANADATAAWSYTNSAAMLFVAVLGPLLGALADASQLAKRFTAVFAVVGIASAGALVFVNSWWAAAALFVFGTIGLSGSLVFYDSLLPHIAREGDTDRISARGYALGYLGGGILLALNLAWLARPAWFLMPDRDFAMRACFASVAGWWAIFSIPFFRHVPEPKFDNVRPPHPIAESFRRLGRTFRSLRRFRQLALFLAAFWIYNDGIGTVIKIAVAFGDEIGIGQNDLVLALVITQTIAIPCSMLFGPLGRKIGTKRAILLGIAAYLVICPFGFFMRTTGHFYMLSAAVGLVQGGTQALSRSLFATMVPRHRSAEFFGFFSTGEKFAGIIGPLLFGMISQFGNSSRWGIISITGFFILGGFLLLNVNEIEGRRVAAEEDDEMSRPISR